MTRHKWPSQLFFKQLEIVYNCVARQLLYNNNKTIKRKYFLRYLVVNKKRKKKKTFKCLQLNSLPHLPTGV